MSASHFWRTFLAEAPKHPLTKYGGQFTIQIFSVLHGVQRSLGLWCKCGHHDGSDGERGEYLKIDMMWFPEAGTNWDRPLVAIEHENLWSEFETKVDLWRVCQIAAPLRVCFGYSKSRAQAKRTGARLSADALAWRGPYDGEDLIIMGHREMSPNDFMAWGVEASGVRRLDEVPRASRSGSKRA